MNLARVRWAVRGALALGVAASVTANVLHAVDNPISQAIAAWPPLALLIVVELIARVPVHRRWLAAVRLLSAAVLAGIAAWVSYWHMVGVAVRYGEDGLSAYLIPVSVDGLVIVASICLVELSGRDVRVDTRSDNAPDNVGQDPDNEPANEPVNHPVNEPAKTPDVQLADGVDADLGHSDIEGGQGLDTQSAGELLTALKVADAHARNPRATHGQLAAELGVSYKTVQRHRPKSTPGQVNGHDHRFN